MLPTDPNWLSADSALWSAVLAGLTFFVTVAGAWAAWRALIWARKAAEAAQGQIAAMRDQVVLMQPRPVIVLRISYQIGSADAPQMAVANVSDDPAFDVQVGEIGTDIVAGFMPEVVLLKGSDCVVVPAQEKLVNRGLSKATKGQFHLRQVLDEMASRKLSTVGTADLYNVHVLAVVPVTYTNVRGVKYEQQFRILLGGTKFVSSMPEQSLLN